VRIVHALVVTAAIAMAGAVAAGRASAQGRGGGGGGSSDKADTAIKKPGEPGGPMDPERPIGFMIEHRKDLFLADSQVAKLGIIQSQLDAADRPIHQSLDTLPPETPASQIDWAHITPGGRDSIIARRRTMSQASAALHDNALKARNAALAVLTPTQQAKLQSVNQSVENKQLDAQHPASSNNSSGRSGAPGGAGGGRPY
jgi:Spy/CpxP family protein refolding chaperone